MALTKSPTLNYEKLHVFPAAVDLSAKAYHFVKMSATGVTNVNTAQSGSVLGVLINAGPSGADVEVLTEPGTRIILQVGTTTDGFAIGDRVTTDAAGAAIKQTTDGDANCFHAVVVNSQATADTGAKAGKFIECIYTPNTKTS